MTKTISLSDEAYALLSKLKLKGESFSDTIIRLAKRRGKLIEIIDLYPELTELEEFEVAIKKQREEIDHRLRED
ncbi:MAG: antitoxin VapB family protein [Candidatus Hydrothermarchaeota archaeon]